MGTHGNKVWGTCGNEVWGAHGNGFAVHVVMGYEVHVAVRCGMHVAVGVGARGMSTEMEVRMPVESMKGWSWVVGSWRGMAL